VAIFFIFSRQIFFDSSPLKPFGQMNQNLVGSIYGKSSVAIAHFSLQLETRIACGSHIC
jgi:hypothetical protein